MAFTIGSLVVHANHGVGRITGIERKQFFSPESKLYYIIAIPDGIIWAPVEDNQLGQGKLRNLITRSELPEYRKLLASRPEPLDKDYRKRRLEISERMKDGSFQSACTILRDLTALSWQRPLSEADAVLLQKIRQNLCQEWSTADGATPQDVDREIDDLLMEARRLYRE